MRARRARRCARPSFRGVALALVLAARSAVGLEEAKPGMPDPRIERVVRKDWEVVPQMAGAGPDVVRELVSLSASDDKEVRLLALFCLDQTGGSEARAAFLRGLRDPSEAVRARSAQFLDHHRNADDLPALLREIETNPDPFVRLDLPLVVGRIDRPEAAPELRRIAAGAPEPEVRRNLELALARLGDEPARVALRTRLSAPSPAALAAALRDFEYVGDRRLAPWVAPLLDDRRDAVAAGPSHARWWIRVCDVAVDALDTVLDHPFPFAVDGKRRYADSELAAAKSTLAAFRR